MKLLVQGFCSTIDQRNYEGSKLHKILKKQILKNHAILHLKGMQKPLFTHKHEPRI